MDSLYTLVVFITSFSLFVLTVGIRDNHFLSDSKRKRFQILFCMLIALNWLEWFGARLNGAADIWRNIHFFVKFAELSLTPFVAVCSISIVTKTKTKKWFYIPAVLNVFLQLYSLPSGAVFSIDADNVYSRGNLYLLYVLLFVVGALNMFVCCIEFNRKYQHRSSTFLFMISWLITLAIVFPFIFPELRMDWTCTSFAAIIFYIYYNQLEQQVDPLTSLLNRRSYDYAIENIRNETAIIFFDVDNFKTINDTYGHGFGDTCLVLLSTEMKKVFEKKGYCYRFGGDEACVIVKKNVKDIDVLISKYISAVDDLRKKETDIPHISVGYAYFDLEKETAQETVKQADEMMYRYKNSHRQNI